MWAKKKTIANNRGLKQQTRVSTARGAQTYTGRASKTARLFTKERTRFLTHLEQRHQDTPKDRAPRKVNVLHVLEIKDHVLNALWQRLGFALAKHLSCPANDLVAGAKENVSLQLHDGKANAQTLDEELLLVRPRHRALVVLAEERVLEEKGEKETTRERRQEKGEYT